MLLSLDQEKPKRARQLLAANICASDGNAHSKIAYSLKNEFIGSHIESIVPKKTAWHITIQTGSNGEGSHTIQSPNQLIG